MAPSRDDDGSDRRVGYLAASQVLEYEEEQTCGWLGHCLEPGEQCQVGYMDDQSLMEEPRSEVLDRALKYMEHCKSHPKYDTQVIRTAVALGDDLLRSAGTLEKAMQGLREARRRTIGVPTAGATTKEVLECLDANHADYLKAMNAGGVRARRYYSPRRLKAEPYIPPLWTTSRRFTRRPGRMVIGALCSSPPTRRKSAPGTSSNARKDECRSSYLIGASALKVAQSTP